MKELNADAAWIVLYSIGTGIVSFPALYLVRRLFLRYLGDILEGMGKKLLAFLALTLLLCAYMILTMASFFDTIEIPPGVFFDGGFPCAVFSVYIQHAFYRAARCEGEL